MNLKAYHELFCFVLFCFTLSSNQYIVFSSINILFSTISSFVYSFTYSYSHSLTNSLFYFHIHRANSSLFCFVLFYVLLCSVLLVFFNLSYLIHAQRMAPPSTPSSPPRRRRSRASRSSSTLAHESHFAVSKSPTRKSKVSLLNFLQRMS